MDENDRFMAFYDAIKGKESVDEIIALCVDQQMFSPKKWTSRMQDVSIQIYSEWIKKLKLQLGKKKNSRNHQRLNKDKLEFAVK